MGLLTTPTSIDQSKSVFIKGYTTIKTCWGRWLDKLILWAVGEIITTRIWYVYTRVKICSIILGWFILGRFILYPVSLDRHSTFQLWKQTCKTRIASWPFPLITKWYFIVLPPFWRSAPFFLFVPFFSVVLIGLAMSPRVVLKNFEFMDRIARCKTYLFPWGSIISTSPSGNSGNPAALAAELTGACFMRKFEAPAKGIEMRDLLVGGGPAGDNTGEDRTCFWPVGRTGIVIWSRQEEKTELIMRLPWPRFTRLRESNVRQGTCCMARSMLPPTRAVPLRCTRTTSRSQSPHTCKNIYIYFTTWSNFIWVYLLYA